MTQLHTIYDFSNESMHETFLVPLVFAIIGLYILLYAFGVTKIYIGFFIKNFKSSKQAITTGLLFLIFGSFLTFLIYNNQNTTYSNLKYIYKNRMYLITQGNIENLHASQDNPHDQERFTVNGIKFNFSNDNTDGYGFNTSLWSNHEVKLNRWARIAYYNNGRKNVILKFELE